MGENSIPLPVATALEEMVKKASLIWFHRMFQRWWWWRRNPVCPGSTVCALDWPLRARWCWCATSDWQCSCVCLWSWCLINESVGQSGATFYVPSHTYSMFPVIFSCVAKGQTWGKMLSWHSCMQFPGALRQTCVPEKLGLIICIIEFCKAPLRVEEHKQTTFQLEMVWK